MMSEWDDDDDREGEMKIDSSNYCLFGFYERT